MGEGLGGGGPQPRRGEEHLLRRGGGGWGEEGTVARGADWDRRRVLWEGGRGAAGGLERGAAR